MKRSKLARQLFFFCKTVMITSLCSVCLFTETTPRVYAKTNAGTKAPIVVLDPGHGGIDSGTQHENILEKDIVLAISKEIAEQLKHDHIIVYMTRDSDRDNSQLYSSPIASRHRRDLFNRVQFFHEHQADIVISLHVNHSGSVTSSGGNVFYQRHHPFSAIFAPILQDTLNTFYHNKEKPLSGPYYILRASKIPVFLVEIGFLSNTSDRSKLIDPVWQHKFSQTMAKSIELGLLLQFHSY